jgi:ABC-type bacteriocin/lantibiotic exporter with double-glycine peptidase domain
MKAGAGGNWKKFDEKFDSIITKQTTGISCVSAVGEMLLKMRGISISQEFIRDIIGEPSDVVSLARCLNKFDVSAGLEKWHGIYALPNEVELVLSKKYLAVILQEPLSLGHAVVVGKTENDVVYIVDPFDQTSYRMMRDDFENVWGGGAIFYGTN